MTPHDVSAYGRTRKSILSSLYGYGEILPGLLAMLFIGIFANNLPGVPNPFTLENLFAWLDGVVGPLHHTPLFQILNSNFVWNPLLLGLLVGNVFGVPDSWKRGLSLIHMLMPLGIILLAPHFPIGHAFKLGLVPMLLCVAALLGTAGLTLLLARLCKVDDRHGAVIAGGLCTGDPHACAILMPLIKAKGGQVVNAAAGLVVFGLVAMAAMPVLAGWLGLPEQAFGLAAVLGVGNGAQATSAAFAYGYEAGRYAGWFDVGRLVIMPAGFLSVFSVMFVRKLRHQADPDVRATRGIDRFPVWLGVFVVCWLLACLHLFHEPARHAMFVMVKWTFSLAAASLGLSLSWRDVLAPGPRGLAVIAMAGIIRMAAVLAMVAICIKTGLLPQ
ncbi:MAG: putative sulfate exporter family transporter [Desulfovibrionaceae bacterium]|jgi:uncharacterized membrane protein YadS|nr:putative sulfate exporter family transporter [Desulfovibrionaceae bacterium]